MEEIEGTSKAAVESCHKVLNLLSTPKQDDDNNNNNNLVSETKEALFKFKRVGNLLNTKTIGHARFRRSNKVETQTIPVHQTTQLPPPSLPPPQETKPCLPFGLMNDSLTLGTKSFTLNPNVKPPFLRLTHLPTPPSSSTYHNLLLERLHLQKQKNMMLKKIKGGGISLSFDNNSSSTRSFISSLSIDPSVANNVTDQNPNKRKCLMKGDEHETMKCHCSKKRKQRVRRSIRVPAISNKVADIPPDDYSWRKYGQKPIKGSPYPRGYYKCSSMRGCPARKHVERCLEDPSMLIVTYEAEHSHAKLPTQTITT